MKRLPCLSIILVILCILCLGLLAAAWMIKQVPPKAVLVYGPPARGLSFYQRNSLAARLLLQQEQLTTGFDPQGSPHPFEIKLGESTYDITNRLQRDGLIGDANLLRDYLIYSGLDKTIQAGKYTLNPRNSPLEIAQSLQDATPAEVTFGILPGWRLEEIAAALPTSGLGFSVVDFMQLAKHPPDSLPLAHELPPGASLEGFLFPDSYRLPRAISPQDFLKTALDDFQTKVTPDLIAGYESQNLTLFQAVTLASLVQREAIVEEEMPMIASVFANRLSAGMRLDSDPTVQYALGKDRESGSWWKSPLSLEDLQVISPYNTYQIPGLPPGPIANPSLSALRAVAFPAETPYYYFRAACDGSGRHSFAETFEQHDRNSCP
jgi:peptidoglycan lytic transglycosylase G